jgi:hypothetical protein
MSPVYPAHSRRSLLCVERSVLSHKRVPGPLSQGRQSLRHCRDPVSMVKIQDLIRRPEKRVEVHQVLLNGRVGCVLFVLFLGVITGRALLLTRLWTYSCACHVTLGPSPSSLTEGYLATVLRPGASRLRLPPYPHLLPRRSFSSELCQPSCWQSFFRYP